MMKRILIFSDTHGYINDCVELINRFKPDAVIHAGDCARDCEDLMSVFPETAIYGVSGNNDFYAQLPNEISTEICGKKVFVTHGHAYRVKYESNYRTLAARAQECGAQLCVFGHTHIPYNDNNGRMIVLNPGSIRFGGTYGICEIDENTMRTDIIAYRS